MPNGDNLGYVPHNTTALDVTPVVRRTQFGDGYAQERPAWMNSAPRKFSIVWDNITATLAYTIHQFLYAHSLDQTWFYFQMPSGHPFFPEQMRYRVDTYSIEFDNNLATVKATIHQIFDN